MTVAEIKGGMDTAATSSTGRLMGAVTVTSIVEVSYSDYR
jgi:hypothetical protein